jgi:hypothetical protein
MIGKNSLSSLNILTQSFLGGERLLALDISKQIYEPFYLLLHRWC